jgi:hypothetical protein
MEYFKELHKVLCVKVLGKYPLTSESLLGSFQDNKNMFTNIL